MPVNFTFSIDLANVFTVHMAYILPEYCIDALRQSTMCWADTTSFLYHWNDFSRTPAPTWIQKHECVNWGKLTEWLDTTVIDICEAGMLTHPKYGTLLLLVSRIEN